MKPVTHLHFHSEFSLQDSVIKIDMLPKLIEEKNVKAIALTDHGNVDGAVKFYQKTKDIKSFDPLLGCEFYVVDDYTQKESKIRYHLTTIAKNLKGFQSIMKALTVANLEGFYWRPRISWEYILEHMEHVVVMTACISGPFGYPEKKRDLLLADLYEKFGEDFYLEAMLLEDYKPQEKRNREILDFHQKYGIQMVFTNDVHYPDRDDWTAREICRAIAYHQKIDPEKYDQLSEDQISSTYLKNYDEMVESLKFFGLENYEEKMVEVWDEIVDKCKCDWLQQMEVMVPVAYDKAKANPG